MCSPRRSSYSDAVEGQRKTPKMLRTTPCLATSLIFLPFNSWRGGREWAYGRSRCLFCLLNCVLLLPVSLPVSLTSPMLHTHTTWAPHIHGRGGGTALKTAPTSTCPLQMSPSAFQPHACLLPSWFGFWPSWDCVPHRMDILMCSARLEPDLRFPFF